MARKRSMTKQIICKLRAAEVELARGHTTGRVCKKLGIADQTYDRWRQEYGRLRVDQAKYLKQLDRESSRFKRIVADQAVDVSILTELSKKHV